MKKPTKKQADKFLLCVGLVVIFICLGVLCRYLIGIGDNSIGEAAQDLIKNVTTLDFDVSQNPPE